MDFIKVKQLLVERLKIAGFILALVGWLMLVTVPLELLGRDLSGLESMFETSAFKWGLRIFVLLLVILLIKGQDLVSAILDKHIWLRKVIKIIIVVGVIGWIISLVSLL